VCSYLSTRCPRVFQYASQWLNGLVPLRLRQYSDRRCTAGNTAAKDIREGLTCALNGRRRSLSERCNVCDSTFDVVDVPRSGPRSLRRARST
jgi:hypothetical protein